jgi:tetratricopeptide (TPR) repeat protein
VLAGAAGLALAAAPAPPKSGPAVPAEPPARLNWRTDVDAAIREAAAARRVVLIYFRADWSQPCQWMERGPFAARKMAAYIEQHFIPVRVDDTAGPGPAAKRYEVRVYPTLLLLDGAGTPLHIVLGPREAPALHAVLEEVCALPALVAGQKAKPDDLEANFALGNAFAKLNQLRRAAPYLEKAAELDPDNRRGRQSQAVLMLAMVPLEDGDVKTTLENLDTYLRQFRGAPEAPLALHFKGTVLYRDGRLHESRAVFEQLRQTFPKHRMAYEADKAIAAIEARLRAAPPAEAPPAEKNRMSNKE